MKFFIVFLLCLAISTVPVQSTTVRVGVTSKVVAALQQLIWEVVQPSLAGYLPSVAPANITCCTNFTKITFNQTSNIDKDSSKTEFLPNIGIRFNFTGFSTVISWTLNWKYEDKQGVLDGNTILNLDISNIVTFHNNAGVPKFQVLNLKVINWSVVPSNYSIPPALQKAPDEAIKLLITENKFQSSFAKSLEDNINTKISVLFGTGGLEIPLNLTGIIFPVFVNYTLSEDIVFSDNYFSLGLEVSVRLNNTQCPIKDILPPLNQNHDILISVSHTILDCLFNDIATTNLGLFAAEKKIVDSRFRADIFATPTATWAPSDFTIRLDTNLDIPVSGLLKTVVPLTNVAQNLANFSINASTIIKIVLNITFGSVDAGLVVNSLKLNQLSCKAVPNSPLLNTPYADQLNKENWAELSKKIMSLLPPEIYSLYSLHFADISPILNIVIRLYLKDVGFVVNPDYVTLQADWNI